MQVLKSIVEVWEAERVQARGTTVGGPKPQRPAPRLPPAQPATGKHVLFQVLDPATTWAPMPFNISKACAVLEGPTGLSSAEEEQWCKCLVGWEG